MTDLHALLDDAVTAIARVSATTNPYIRKALDNLAKFDAAVADELQPIAPPPVTPPPTPKVMWGISPGTPYVPDISTQAKVWVDLGALCPRIAAVDSVVTACLNAGIKHFFAWFDKSASVAQCVAFLQKYPQCLGLEWGNELNLDGAFTVKSVSDRQKAFFAAAKTAGVESRVMLSSVGNDISHAEHLSMLDWCKGIVANGAGPGSGFTIANYHNYGLDPHKEDLWQELWTVGRHGTCAQDVFGKPPFVLSECGAKIGWTGIDLATQAQAAMAWPLELSKVPECIAAHWFLSHDGAVGGPWNGFGLVDPAGNHRPSYAAFKAAIA